MLYYIFRNITDHLTVYINKMCLQIMHLIYTLKQDLVLNNQQCHKTQPNQIPYI